MPNYNAQTPPYSIFPGDVALAFNSEAPGAGQASQQFALPSYAGNAEQRPHGDLANDLWERAFGNQRNAANRDERRGWAICDGGHIDGDGRRNTDGNECAGEFYSRKDFVDYWGLGNNGAGAGVGFCRR